MRLLIERSPHGWRCHVLDMDLYGPEGISVWHAIELAADAIEASAPPYDCAHSDAWDAFEAAIGCGLCEWCGRLCPAWSAMCRKCAAPLGGLPEVGL